MKIRSVTWDDLEAVDLLVVACNVADVGERAGMHLLFSFVRYELDLSSRGARET